jgi:small subunit ribosomal protein S1
MVETGSIIKAQVVKFEPHAVWLEYQNEKIIVLIPEITWKIIRHPSEIVRLGESLSILVLRYNYKDKLIVGSIKRLHPEENPYRELSRLSPGTSLPGRVDLVLPEDILVELENGARGRMAKKLLRGPLGRGAKVDVVISSLEVEEGLLVLEPAFPHLNPGPQSPNQTSVNPMLT